MRTATTAVLVLVTLAAACGPGRPAVVTEPTPTVRADDPPARVLTVGVPAEGVLTSEDPVWGTNGPFHLYRFEARANDRVSIAMRSDDFDTYLVVGDRAGGIFNPLDQDDDSGGDLDARLRFVAPRTGTYWVIAQAYAEYGMGAYTLELDELAPPRPVTPVALATGGSAFGELTEDDGMTEEDEKFYDLYTFQARAGQRYAVSMTSPAFDTYLLLGTGTSDFEEITRDDDSGGGTDSRITFTADETRTYTVQATSFGPGSTGDYSIALTELAPPGPVTVQSIAFGRSTSGNLDWSDAEGEDGSFYDIYTFRGRDGQRLAITLRSEDFDSFLELGEMEGDEFFTEYSDDDGAGGLDSRLIVTLWQDGEYSIRATSLGSAEVGDYTLLVEELPEPGPASVRAITVGQPMHGELEPTDAMLDDQSFYDIYTFRGTAGQRVRITLRSDEFDAYLAVGHWRNGDLDEIDSDDDSAGNLDSMLELTLPATGEYGIRANSLGGQETGAYTVTVEEM